MTLSTSKYSSSKQNYLKASHTKDSDFSEFKSKPLDKSSYICPQIVESKINLVVTPPRLKTSRGPTEPNGIIAVQGQAPIQKHQRTECNERAIPINSTGNVRFSRAEEVQQTRKVKE